MQILFLRELILVGDDVGARHIFETYKQFSSILEKWLPQKTRSHGFLQFFLSQDTYCMKTCEKNCRQAMLERFNFNTIRRKS